MSYTHLQVHSGYSLLDSTISIEKLVSKAKELEFDAIALTDHEVLYGVIPFYQLCLKNNLKPIIGMTVELIHDDYQVENCILLAKNNKGYQQLIELSTWINKDEQRLTLPILQSHAHDLIGILPVQTSVIAELLINDRFDQAKAIIDKWLNVFSAEDFYLGIQDHGLASERSMQQMVKNFHEAYEIQVVAINDVRYLERDDYVAFDCLQAIKEQKRWREDEDLTKIKNRYLRSQEEMEQMYQDFWLEPLENTEKIKEKCHVTLAFQQALLPAYPTPNELPSHDFLRELCFEQAKQKYAELTDEVVERLNYELDVIDNMGFSDYFLIVWDFVAYAKKNNILVGPGRGSAAGSLVSFVLGITEVDPLKYDLLFERFLNPERTSMPDIDIDFADHSRDEVIQYVRNKYGEEHVAQIITFGTFGARSLLRELFKTMGVDQQDISYIFQIIPPYTNKSIVEYVRESTDLQAYIKQSPKLRKLFKIAFTLDGLPRHISTHAAGIVMSKRPLTENVPLTLGSNDVHLTQFPMNDLEALGLLKIDFLGLRNLTFMEQVIQSIAYRTEKHISLQQIPSDDQKTFQLLQQGKTNGIFQLESEGMKRVLQRLQPSEFEDIVAVNALYRPGPMNYIDTYIRRKRKEENVSYPHPDLEPILAKTYGVLIYQEQIMQIAHRMAGFSLGEADILRRAISKKSATMIKELKVSFIKGCMENGYDAKLAEQIFLWIERFADYGFNRSHAVAYSKISYQLAYLKAHYPTDFFAELFSTSLHQRDKITQYVKEAREFNIEILPPCINQSFAKYTVEEDSIRMGLLAIKGIGYQTVKAIINMRKDQPFTSLFDFCLRMPRQLLQRKTLELLILSGAFDQIHSNRASLLASVDQAIEQAELFGGLHQQTDLLADSFGLQHQYQNMTDFSQMKKLSDEKELLGIYISSHPLREYREQLTTHGFQPLMNVNRFIGKRNIRSAVVLQAVRKIRTKRGDPMAFLTVGDESGEMEAVIFPDLYRHKHYLLQEESLVLITGKIEKRKQQTQWILSDIQPFDPDSFQPVEQRLFIKLTEEHVDQALTKIRHIAKQYSGSTPIIVYYEQRKQTYQLATRYNVDVTENCLQAFKQEFGVNNVVLQKKN